MYKLDLIFGTSVDKTEIKKVESQLDALYKKYQNKNINLGVDSKATKAGLDDVSKSMDNTSKATKSMSSNINTASKSTSDFSNRMRTAISSTIEWTVAVGGLYAVINKLKESIGFTVGFDTSLTEIAMVTGRTREEVAGLKDEYLELGAALKVSSLELANSAVALYRQGLSAQEVNDRLGEISKTAKVAGMSVEEVTKFVTSGTNAMKVSAQEFNDVLLKVASVSATDYGRLGEAFQKSATGFLNAGYSLEQAAGTLAVIQEVTQESATSIGTSMKTILARFGKLTDAGEDNTKALNDIDKAVSSVGISFTDLDGQMRPPVEIIGELAEKWDGLNINTRSYIGTTIAGVRQLERFRVLMENYGRAVEITDEAYSAAGTTQEQYLKFQESIQGKLNELQVAWEEFYSSMVDSDAIIGIVEFATLLVRGLTSASESVGVLNIAFVSLLTILALTQTGFRTLAFELIPQFLVSIRAGKVSMDMFTGSMGAAKIGAIALQAAMTAGVAIAIAGVVSAIGWAVKAHKEWEERLDTSMAKVSELKGEIDRLNSEKVQLDVEGVDSQDLAILEKELEIKEALLEIEERRAASLANEMIPAIEDYNKYSMSGTWGTTGDVSGVSRLVDPEKEKQVIAAYNATAEEIKRLRAEQEALTVSVNATDAETKRVNDTFEKLDKTIIELTDNQSTYESKMLDQLKVLKDVKQELLTPEALAHMEYLENLLGLTEDNTDALDDYTDSLGATKYELSLLNSMMGEYISTGKLSESTVKTLISNQGLLDLAFGDTEDSLGTLLQAYGYSAEETLNIQKQLTEELIKQSRTRMNMMLLESRALMNQYNALASSGADIPENLQRSLYGAGTKFGEAENDLNRYLAQLDEIDTSIAGLSKSSTKSAGASKSSADATKEYDSTMDSLNRKIHAYNLLVEQQATYGTDNYDAQVAAVRNVVSEIETLLERGYADWSKMALGTEEYAKQEEYLRDLGIDRYKWMQKVNDVLKEQEVILNKLGEQYQKQVEGGIKRAIDALNRQKKETTDYYDGLIKAKQKEIDAQRLKDDLENRELERKKKLLEIEKAREYLANVQEQRTYKQLQEDGTFEYVANPKEVKNAQEQLKTLQTNYDEWELQNQKADDLRKLENEKAAYENSKTLALEDLDAKIEIQNSLMSKLAEIEIESYSKRMEALRAFVSDYNREMRKIGGDSITMSPISSGGSRTEKTVVDTMKENAQKWHTAPADVKDLYVKQNEAIAPSGWNKDSSGVWYDENGIRAFGNGGHLSSPEIILAGDESESIIPDSIMPGFLARATMEIMSALPKLGGLGSQSVVGGSPNNFYGDIKVQANNADQFVASMRQLIQTGVNI
jgi:TP901 family phage tail tape measure protein